MRRRRLACMRRRQFHALASQSFTSCHSALVRPLKDGFFVENRGRIFNGHSAWHSPGIHWAFNGPNLAFRTCPARGTLFFVDHDGPVFGWKLPNYNISRGEGSKPFARPSSPFQRITLRPMPLGQGISDAIHPFAIVLLMQETPLGGRVRSSHPQSCASSLACQSDYQWLESSPRS